MNIALPLTSSGAFATRYGEATRFEVFTVDRDHHTIRRRLIVVPRASRPCQWPRLLRAAGVRTLLAGSMGEATRQAMIAAHIDVLAGIGPDRPDALIEDWLTGHLHDHVLPPTCPGRN